MHPTSLRVARSILRRWGDVNTVFRDSEIPSIAVDLGYRRHMPQFDASEWLASILCDLGRLAPLRASIMDPASLILRYRDGLPIPYQSNTTYVCLELNALLADNAAALRAILTATSVSHAVHHIDSSGFR